MRDYEPNAELLINFYTENCRTLNKEIEALKEENKKLKEEAEYRKVCTDKNIERYETYRDALKALRFTVGADGEIMVRNSRINEGDIGYADLKKYLELQEKIDHDCEKTD